MQNALLPVRHRGHGGLGACLPAGPFSKLLVWGRRASMLHLRSPRVPAVPRSVCLSPLTLTLTALPCCPLPSIS